MRPLRLGIEGLRSFRSPVSIDFAGRDHVAIVGDTGAGKSSILEAITYALYGQTTFTAQANQELLNDQYTHLRVVLRFRVSGETWEVARSLRRGGGGEVGQARAQLRRLGGDGEAVEQLEQVRPVNERVKELLGLDSDAFLRTVVLPQGRFARLLVEDRPTDRGRILRQVWRTDELEAAGEVAGRARHEAEKLRIRLEQALSVYPEDPAGHLRGLRQALDEARRHAAEAGAEEEAAAAARTAVRESEAVRGASASAVERLQGLDTGAVAATLAPLAELDRQLDEEDSALKEQEARLTRALDDVPVDDGPTSEEVAAALTKLKDVDGFVADSEKTAADLRKGAAEAAERAEEAERLADGAQAAERRAAAHAAGRVPLEQAAQAARERDASVQGKYSRCEALADDVAGTRERLEALRADASERDRALESAREEEGRAARVAGNADEHLAAAQRKESAANAAHDLHPGDACPICRRQLPGGWTAPDGAGLIEARRVADAAHRTVREAAGRVTELETELRAVRRQVRDSEAGLGELESGFGQAWQDLGLEVELGREPPLPERDTLLAPLVAACQRASKQLEEHDRVGEELRAAATREDKEADVARAGAASARVLAERLRRTAEQTLQRLQHTIREVPRPYRPALDLPPDPLELEGVDTRPVAEQKELARERSRLLKERNEQRDALRRDIEAAREGIAALAASRAERVHAPIEALVRRLNSHRDVLVQSVGRLALDTEVPEAVSGRDVHALGARLDDLRTTAEDVLHRAGELAREASAKADATREELAAIGERLNLGADVLDIEAVVAAARARAERARFEERGARESERHFARILDDIGRLQALLREARDKELALGDLESALKPGAFLKWLTLRRSRNLLVHASRMLGEMSGGKYAFVDPGDTEEQWLVLDRDSGQARSPASLSGGEQFIASLALALGMVEMMARSGGRLESLFLDEGFGTLDRNNLDAAVQALATVATGGRMVGVISHVRAVAEQIEHVLAVTRDAAGSRAEWLTDRQRRRLSESDVGLEATSALTGLLE